MDERTRKAIERRLGKLERLALKLGMTSLGDPVATSQGIEIGLGSGGAETDPIASAALAAHEAEDRADNVHGLDTELDAIDTALAGKQPLDSDLTAIAALTTTSFGRSLLALADAAAGRTALGLTLPPLCRVYKAATQSINNNTVTTLTFDSERFDTDSMHESVTNPTRITIPLAGVYAVTVYGDFAPNATGSRILYVYLNGAGSAMVGGIRAQNAVAQAGVDTYDSFAMPPTKFAAGDYIEAKCYQNSGGALAIAAEFSAAYLGPG